MILSRAVQQVPQAVDVDSLLRANAPQNSLFFEGPVQAPDLGIALLVGLLLSLLVRWHFRRYSSTFSTRDQLANIFPVMVLTTLLIITIVKSSLALSLGLVGALSIVRFRTPIKEPEELTYLFVCIAIGLGLGANQIGVTVVSSLFILLVAGVISVRHRSEEGQDIYLSVGWIGDSPSIGTRLDALNSVLAEHTIHTDLRRVDSRDGALEANYFVRFRNGDEIPRLFDRFDQEYGRGTVSLSIIDQSRTLGP